MTRRSAAKNSASVPAAVVSEYVPMPLPKTFTEDAMAKLLLELPESQDVERHVRTALEHRKIYP
jgi:hypothetical protein